MHKPYITQLFPDKTLHGILHLICIIYYAAKIKQTKVLKGIKNFNASLLILEVLIIYDTNTFHLPTMYIQCQSYDRHWDRCCILTIKSPYSLKHHCILGENKGKNIY